MVLRSFQLTLLSTLLACAVPAADPTTSCDEVECPSGSTCVVGADAVAFCAPAAADLWGPCELPCGGDEECRGGRCLAPDLDGEVCEFDDICHAGHLCVSGRCTWVACVGEVCDGVDNDCDGEVDEMEDTIEECYSGPEATRNVGACVSGFRVCEDGRYTACRGEVLPRAELGVAACNARDDDCDGVPDGGTHSEVDIVFAFDVSGSMSDEFLAVVLALEGLADHFSVPEVRMGLVVFPRPERLPGEGDETDPVAIIPLSSYDEFLTAVSFAYLVGTTGNREASYDVAIDIAEGRIEGAEYRSAARRVLVMFTDEPGQSFAEPPADESALCGATDGAGIELHVVTDTDWRGAVESYDDCAEVHPLSTDPAAMVVNLAGIADAICS